ncbi:rhoGEF domain-containing protein gxcJ-like isoform X1 [Condylostylus longicornis]|uniref:rhoGEF domain-containing protein gxcJ-like isoform X1 n=1 Tax=Condylostylus longicornis TaxID=2530218 RepID=UPI00244DE93D|nr:rhoGEF domain-containing protein gxcJ-like isoform X1 [Condylostylus longicornis]
MPGGSFNHSSKADEKILNSQKTTKSLSTKKSSAAKCDSKNEKAKPGKATNVINDSSSTQLVAITNEKSRQLQQQTTKKSLNFIKACSSSNSVSPSKLPPPPSPPTLSKTDAKTFLKIENREKEKMMCEAIATISDNNKKNISANSLKPQKSSLQSNKSKPDSICCTLCSSSDVNEITLKIKACQSCNNVSIDQINCSGQILSSPNDIISTLTGQSSINFNYQSQQPPPVSTVQQCYHHLTNITQKLRNMYKNQIHTSQSQSSSQRSSIVTIPEQDIPMEFFKTQQTDAKSQLNSSKHFHFSVKKTSPNTDQPQSEKQSNNSTINLISSKPNISSIFNNTSNISKSKYNQKQETSSKCNINGDVLVLKICDLDHSSNLSNKKCESMGKVVETTKAVKLSDLNDFDHEKSSNRNNSNNNNNNEISFIKKDCQHENFNPLRRQSSVDVATSPSLCSPAQEVTVFNLSPDEIKVEKITSPAPITISPTYFSDNNKKLKISLKRNDSYQSGDSGKLSPSQMSFPKISLPSRGSCEKRSPKSHQLQKSPSGTNYQLKQNKIKIPRKTQSFQGDDIPTTDRSKNLVNKSYRKIMVMSEYNKDKNKIKYNKHSDFLNSNLNHRRSLMKKSKQQNSEISKSLDILLPSDILNDFSDLPDSFFNLPPYTLTSKSTSNLNAIVNDYDDDDEGPFEHINSVELIFISDEFLNKAVKHDLKIINCTTDLNEKVRSPIEIKVSKPNVSSTSSSKTSSKNKLQKGSSSTESKTIKTPDSVSGGSSRKNSISPSRPDKPLITKNLSDLNIGSKKLIVISEDFKRKSLENTVIIINQTEDDDIKPPYPVQHQELALKNLQNSKDRSPSECGTTINSSSDCIDDSLNANLKSNTKTTTKRKNLKELKSWGRESSVDDVGNQMVSHAFCSAEEPDELCLENKEIVESIK